MKAGVLTNRRQIIDDFRVSVVILLGSTNSGQTSIRCCDLAAMLEPQPSGNCKCLTMALEVKYIFPTFSSGANFYICQLSEGLGIRKILAHGIRMQKFPQTRADISRIFTDFHRIMRVQS